IKEVKTATVAAIRDISAASAQALNAVATPLSEVSKALVKMAEDSRASASKNAEETQRLLIQALTNRIIEGDQMRTKSNSVTDDIKEVLSLFPMLQATFGDAVKLPQSVQPELPGLTPPDGKPKTSA